MPKKGLSPKYQVWVDARKRFHLSHAQVQMARELGMNPKKLGKLDNHKQEPWKLPLRLFIEECYKKRFRKDRPDAVRSIEEMVREGKRKKALRKARRLAEKAYESESDAPTASSAGDSTVPRGTTNELALNADPCE